MSTVLMSQEDLAEAHIDRDDSAAHMLLERARYAEERANYWRQRCLRSELILINHDCGAGA